MFKKPCKWSQTIWHMENSLTTAINFISSKDNNEQNYIMHSRSDNIEIMGKDKADEVIKKSFDSLENRY